MRPLIKLIFIGFFLTSCAKIPSQSIPLMDGLIVESNRMHALNKGLLDQMFKDKRRKIDEFIENEYTPTFISNFQKRIPANVDVKAELPGIIASITPRIAARRDSMQVALEIQRIKLDNKLDQDYEAFKTGMNSIRRLLDSAVKVDKERDVLYS